MVYKLFTNYIVLDFDDAFIFECVIPKYNVFWQDVFNSFLCVIKS